MLDDHTASVRREQVNVLAKWLSDRAKCLHCDAELEAIIFSILLGSVGDDTPEVAKAAIVRIEEVAAAWWSPANTSPCSGNANDDARVEGASRADNNSSSRSGAGGLCADNLPAPFEAVPSEAAQKLVCELLPRVLPPVLHALSDWKVSRRLATVSTLQALFVFGHRDLTGRLREVLAAMVLQVGVCCVHGASGFDYCLEAV